ncbi:hypothetical protein [Amycolatopsis jejuensis]|uniref:hypothetical protein n=1 Tax=Amycolatopsis jejuensis TaxID=330084 RepID=UPI0012E07E6A|nr:hypothetical protein [Amycolatopsis jejuensis]
MNYPAGSRANAVVAAPGATSRDAMISYSPGLAGALCDLPVGGQLHAQRVRVADLVGDQSRGLGRACGTTQKIGRRYLMKSRWLDVRSNREGCAGPEGSGLDEPA